MRLIVVSGQSGAGKSVALRVLEDLGYYCVDNLPIDLLEAFLQSVQGSKQNVAVSIDIRNLPHDPSLLSETFRSLKEAVSYTVNVLFLDATEDALLKRYSETRRIHPLSLHNNTLTLAQAIAQEKQILAPLKKQADMLLDSTNKSIHELSETIRMRVEGRERKHLIIVFESFGFKYGLPSDADFVFDVRFLPNPHWQPELRAFTGLDAPVKSFLEQQTEVIDMRQHIQSFIDYWLPSLEKNNRSYLTIAIGCTGGKHRSVYLTQQIGEYFSQLGHQVQIRHTSLEKNTP